MRSILGAAAIEVAEKVWASVVQVSSNGHGHGAGTIWRPDGAIVTNHHVAPGETARVLLADGRDLPGRVVARDEANDLAVVKIEAEDLPAVTVGNARALRPGEIVLAVGHPFGVKNAVTVGLVTAPPRAGEGGREMVQADVLLGPGNSGGPLANARGEVVGINSMTGGGLALAVPSHLAERLVGAPAARPMLGLKLQDVDLPLALAERAKVAPGRAAMIAGLADGGPAERAGLQIGDLLLALDGRPIQGSEGLVAALAANQGGPIRLRLLRGGAPTEAVLLPERPQSRAA